MDIPQDEGVFHIFASSMLVKSSSIAYLLSLSHSCAFCYHNNSENQGCEYSAREFYPEECWPSAFFLGAEFPPACFSGVTIALLSAGDCRVEQRGRGTVLIIIRKSLGARCWARIILENKLEFLQKNLYQLKQMHPLLSVSQGPVFCMIMTQAPGYVYWAQGRQ